MSPDQEAAPQSRPTLDAFWLAKLHQEGLDSLLPEAPMPPLALAQCVHQLNDQRYFEAHESLEELWLPAPYPLKLFYYALIKLAVGLLQIERRNARATITQLQSAIQHLAPFTPAFMGIGTDSLVQQSQVRVRVLQEPEDVRWKMMDALPSLTLIML